ncbi:MAG: SDR family oxidoreductase [Immundisolibacteraceae bacterium]|nr:SDR family oxidoreductase [Immundisolibacteraceae bacterium]
MSELLTGKTIIVTGAARGIGQAYSLALAAQGANLVIGDILDTADTVAQIKAAGSGSAIGVALDVTSFDSCKAMAAATLDSYGRIDGLINNAALFGPSDKTKGAELMPFDAIDEQMWDNMMAVNVKGTWNCCKAVVPAMREQNYGKIINISSNTVALGAAHLLHYVTSKGAIATLSRCLAKELGPDGIRVNTISPGFIQSQASLDIMENFDAGAITDDMKNICALGREQYPDDLVGSAIYLCSELSDFVSGQTIYVDGGATFSGI